MKKIKIGIPRTSIYNKEGALLKDYFLNLGCKIILSSQVNEQVFAKNNLPTNTCEYIKNYYSHIIKLMNGCDYIVISKYCEYYPSCRKNDYFLKSLACHFSSDQILTINPYKWEVIEYLKIGIKITKNPLRIIISYYLAKQKQKRNNNNKINHQINKLNNNQNKILIVSNYNNLENNDTVDNIINYLKHKNIAVLKSNHTKEKEAIIHSSYFKSGSLSIETKKLVGSIYYYRYCIKGIIYLSSSNCTIDTYIINNIKNDIKEIPIINININEDNLDIETALKILIKNIN